MPITALRPLHVGVTTTGVLYVGDVGLQLNPEATGVVFTVSVAGALVTAPATFVTATVYTWPFKLFAVAPVVYDVPVAPVIAVPFTYHW